MELRIRPRSQYRMITRDQFNVEEVGRYSGKDEVHMESWSRESGDPIPEACQVPLVHLPTSLPLSLHWRKMIKSQFRDYTDGCFRVKNLRPDNHIGDIYFSVGELMTWACRENYNIRNIDTVVKGGILKVMGETVIQIHDKWDFAVYFYQHKLFIDNVVEYNDTDEENDLPRVTGIPWHLQSSPKQFIVKLPAHAVYPEARPGDDGTVPGDPGDDGTVPGSRPYMLSYTPEAIRRQNLHNYNKTFKELMRNDSGGGGEESSGEIVVVVTIGEQRILTAPPVMWGICQLPDGEQDSLDNYVDIQTHKPVNEENQRWFNKYKSVHLWARSALFGINTVYCGHRTDDGQLVEIRRHTVQELANLGRQYWYPGEIPSFLDALLTWVRRRIQEGNTYTLSSNGDGTITLHCAEHPELKKEINDKYPIENFNGRRHPRTMSMADMSDNWRVGR